MIRKRPFVLSLAALVIVAASLTNSAGALEVDPQKLTEIRQNCTSAQINLKQLQKRDAVSRINRGRAYDSLLRQVSALNSRFAYNKITSVDFVQISTDLQNRIDQFREVYSDYDEQLSHAISIDCKQQTTKFYEYIVEARNQRTALAAEVTAITNLAEQYRTKLVEYQTSLPNNAAEGVVNQ